LYLTVAGTAETSRRKSHEEHEGVQARQLPITTWPLEIPGAAEEGASKHFAELLQKHGIGSESARRPGRTYLDKLAPLPERLCTSVPLARKTQKLLEI
jgi:hypothetical protein